jgi:hypothetical protein
MTRERRLDEIDDAPLTRDEILSVFRGFIRYPSLLQDAIRVDFNESYFKGGENVFFVLFSALRGLYQEFRVVSKEMLTTRLAAWHGTASAGLSDADILFLFGENDGQGFLDAAFDTPMPDAQAQRGEKQFLEGVLKRFMNARLIKPNLQNLLNRSTEDSYPVQFRSLLDRWNRVAQRVDHIGVPTANSAAMPTFGAELTLPPPAMATGLPLIDQYLGGIRPGDVIGVLAPYGGGKTTLLATIAVRLAELYYTRDMNKLSVFVGYEDGAERMNPLFWSAATRIARDLFINSGSTFWGQFSDRSNLKDYDRRLPENRNGEIVFGERERWDAAMGWFNRHFVFLDFSANEATGGRGTGGVREIKAALERLVEDRGMEIGTVCVDYTGLLVERELGATGNVAAKSDLHAIIRPIKQVPDDLRIHVAVPMRTTVFLAHQLAPGEVKKFKPYQYIGHLDASGSKSFAENVHSCLGINQKDHTTKVSTTYWSKIRMAEPLSRYGLIRMDDTVVDIHLVNDEYVACSASRAIMRKGDVRPAAPAVADATGQRRRGFTVDNFSDDM